MEKRKPSAAKPSPAGPGPPTLPSFSNSSPGPSNGLPTSQPTLKTPKVGGKAGKAAVEGAESSREAAVEGSKSALFMNNLPYMGELTFGDGRPRRGRKPKKADICHLISKNYGITFPSAYVHEPNSSLGPSPPPPKHQPPIPSHAWDSLLPLHRLLHSVDRLSATPSPQPQPLNLCIRDSDSAHSAHRPSPTTSLVNLSPTTSTTPHPAPSHLHPLSNQPSKSRKKRKCGRRSLSRSKQWSCGGDEGGSKFCSASSAAAAAAAVAASNSAQVSICKFKFTGGLKPCLQEKKMLSVDSGGNFRFYSDKPCPHSAQPSEPESPLLPLPKSAKSMSMCMMPALASASTFTATTPSALSAGNDVMRWEQQEGPHHTGAEGSGWEVGEGGLSPGSSPTTPSSDPDSPPPTSPTSPTGRKRKRRTRKSVLREKLERTFKEKGFLIQTEQLESAEGATYCKFRQLRKFTRYLFRSWKDYLPDTVREPEGEAALEEAAGAQHESLEATDSN